MSVGASIHLMGAALGTKLMRRFPLVDAIGTGATPLNLDGAAVPTIVASSQAATFVAHLRRGEVYALLGASEAADVYAFEAAIAGPDGLAVVAEYTNFYEPTLGGFPCFGTFSFAALETGCHTFTVRGADLHRGMALDVSLLSAATFSAVWNRANLASPVLKEMWDEERARSGAIDALYEGRRGLGPLVEQYPGDPDSAYVTFFFRGGDDLRQVLLAGGPVRSEACLQRFGDTHIYTLTRRVPKDAYYDYAFYTNRRRRIAGDLPFDQADNATYGREVDPLNPSGVMVLPYAFLAPEARSAPVHQGSLHRVAPGVQVYLPPGSAAMWDLPTVVAFDGDSMGGPKASVPLPTILDNLIAAGRVPPMAAVLVDSTVERARDLRASRAYADFVAQELLPQVRRDHPLTGEASRTILAGYSLGGLQAAYTSLLHPETFGAALCLSPSFWADPSVPPDFEHYGENPVVPLLMEPNVPDVRFFLAWGLYEPPNGLTSRHVRDLLRLRGMSVDWREYPSNHCAMAWGNGLVEGLVSLAGEFR